MRGSSGGWLSGWRIKRSGLSSTFNLFFCQIRFLLNSLYCIYTCVQLHIPFQYHLFPKAADHRRKSSPESHRKRCLAITVLKIPGQASMPLATPSFNTSCLNHFLAAWRCCSPWVWWETREVQQEAEGGGKLGWKEGWIWFFWPRVWSWGCRPCWNPQGACFNIAQWKSGSVLILAV